MDIVSAGFLVLVVLLGGFIALFADNLGRRLGKKRHSMFGLRPRHTAALITAGAGILIPFITVGIITYASEDIRKWLFEGREAIRQMASLTQEVDDLKDTRIKLDKDISDKVAQVKKLNESLKNVSARMAQFKEKAEKYLERARLAGLKVVSLQLKMASLTRELENQREQIRTARQDVNVERAKLTKLNIDIKLLDKEIKGRDEYSAKLDKDNKQLENDLKQIRAELGQLQLDKEKAVGELDTANQALTTAREKFSEDIAAKAAELEDIGDRLKRKQAELEQNIDASRFKPMIFSYGEEVARIPLLANQSTADCTSALSSLLRSARISAEQQGATQDSNHLAADMWPITIGQSTVSVETQRNEIIKSISNKGEHFVLIAYSSFNAFKGEWVRLTVKGYRNPVVYTAGAPNCRRNHRRNETRRRYRQPNQRFHPFESHTSSPTG